MMEENDEATTTVGFDLDLMEEEEVDVNEQWNTIEERVSD